MRRSDGHVGELASLAAEDDAVIAADKVVVAALAKADKVSADKWLDPDFTWIDSEGIMWPRRTRSAPSSNRCLPARATPRSSSTSTARA